MVGRGYKVAFIQNLIKLRTSFINSEGRGEENAFLQMGCTMTGFGSMGNQS
jgi:uncharacterized protein (UPF0335 family)